jgi:hypothetical protein
MLKTVTVAACLCATLAQAEASTLSGPQINELVAGATVEIDTPLGTKLPVRYGRDGRLSGEAGGLVSYLGTASDKGRWWVASDRLCHKWNRWFGSEPQCMRLSKEGRVIHWHSQDGYTGTAVVSVPPVVEAKAAPLPAQPSPAKQDAPPGAISAAASGAQAPPAAPIEAAAASSPETAQAAVAEAAPTTAPPTMAPAAKAPPAPIPATASVPRPPQPRPEPQGVAQPQPQSQPMFRVVNVRSDDVLNVRSGPSADFDVVGGLPPGSRGVAIVSACRSAWCPVRHRTASGWVNGAYLAPDEASSPLPRHSALAVPGDAPASPGSGDAADAPRTCLTAAARTLLDRIERQFGPVRVISTCRSGAFIAGTGHPSRHASGNAVDFHAGSRKAAIVEWLIANHRDGGTMTYAGMDHVHADIGPHFVSIANGPRWLSWRDSARDFPHPQQRASSAN